MRTIKPRRLCTVILSFLLLCSVVQAQNNIDRRTAKKVSDSFVGDLVANRLSAAIAKTSDSDPNVPEQDAVRWQYSRILSLCGRPISSKSLDAGVPVLGDGIQSGGNKRVTIVSRYICKTTHYTDQIFAIEVQMADDGKYQISGLSCRNPGFSPPIQNK